MFVKIDNVDMDVFKVEEWIKTNRDANGGVISPEFAMEVLGKTNHFAHIKKVLKNITKACSDENGELVKDKVLAYKDFILSCVDGREMSQQALEVLQDLADACGIREEFDEINKKPKIYNKKDCDNTDIKIVKSREEFEALKGRDLIVFFDMDDVDLRLCNLRGVKELKFKEGAEVKFEAAKNLPKELDVSGCSVVDLRYTELNKVEKIWFKKGAHVNLCGAKNLPKDLDLSKCSRVVLVTCYLNEVENIKLGEGAEVLLCGLKNFLPKDLDVSMCSKVDLGVCDLEGVNLKFREGAKVDLQEAYNLPKELDLSMCSDVDLRWCDLSGVEKITFKEGAEVVLRYAKNLPKKLDLSMCSYVCLYKCDLSGVKKIKFKDKEQKKEFMEGAINFRGKALYIKVEEVEKKCGFREKLKSIFDKGM